MPTIREGGDYDVRLGKDYVRSLLYGPFHLRTYAETNIHDRPGWGNLTQIPDWATHVAYVIIGGGGGGAAGKTGGWGVQGAPGKGGIGGESSIGLEELPAKARYYQVYNGQGGFRGSGNNGPGGDGAATFISFYESTQTDDKGNDLSLKRIETKGGKGGSGTSTNNTGAAVRPVRTADPQILWVLGIDWTTHTDWAELDAKAGKATELGYRGGWDGNPFGGGGGGGASGFSGGVGAAGWLKFVFLSYAEHPYVRQEYDQPGKHTFRIPPGYKYFAVAGFGAGGGGAGTDNVNTGISGEAGDAKMKSYSWTDDKEHIVTVTVGKGGAGGEQGKAGTQGGATIIEFNNERLTAPGGQPGKGTTTNPQNGATMGYNTPPDGWKFASGQFSYPEPAKPLRPGRGGSVNNPNGEKGGGGYGGTKATKTGGAGGDGYVIMYIWRRPPITGGVIS